ncbi:hypothetical protein ACQEVF_15130 [Nonomuraea polychroma]|uniref:hypothetical protein n=1 Tax=Nonomuraea polychroma TaxID=46176 RepID=UPI003D940305
MTSSSFKPHPRRHRHPSLPGQPSPSDVRGPGVFVPQYVIALVACSVVGLVAGVLVELTPAVWPSLDAALAVTGLLVALYGLWQGRHRP